MFGHLLKLVWKRKGRNVMLSLEILIAFIIVFGVAAAGVRLHQLYRMPLGYVHEDVWAVRILPADEVKGTFTADVYDKFKRGLESMPEVKSVAFANTSPFRHSGMRTDVRSPVGARRVQTDTLVVSDGFFDMLGMRMVAGRAFDQRDNGVAALAVVVNRRFARDMFGTDAVVGMQFDASERDSKSKEMMVVTGVIDEFRKSGELEASRPVAIVRHLDNDTSGHMQVILLKMAPGTARGFEEQLNRQLLAIRNDWRYEIEPLASARTSSMAEVLAPLMIGAVIAAFLLAMVAVGLFGVLWQNTTRRIPEMGLRRAVGANAGDIYGQIIGEQLLLSSGAIIVALLLLVQLPITGALGESLNWSVFMTAAALAMGAIYLLSLLCALYPGWRASRLSPTAALHYE
jgi:putative ABC transport system permease protein